MALFSIAIADVIVFICVISALIYWYLTYTFDYWKKRNVVYVKPYPLVGTFGSQFLLKKPPNLILQTIYNEYPNEDIVGGFLARTPELLVRSPDLIKQIFVKDFNHFQDRGFQPNTENEPLTRHLFLANGEQWRTLRQKLTPTFTSGKMKYAFPILTECGEEFQNYIHDILKEGQEPEIRDLMAKFTTEVIGSYAFGIKMNSMKDENAPFRVMGKKIFEPSVIRALKFGFNRIFPEVFKKLNIRLTSIEVQRFFIGSFKSVVESRGNKPSSRLDFVDLLIELKSKGYVQSGNTPQNEPSNELNTFEMTDELLAAQAFIFFGAGFETSSTTLSFVLYELAKNKTIQEELIKEIDTFLVKYDGKITYDALNEMKYLEMVINETLRKYPPATALNRVCTIPYNIPNTKITLDEGTLITIPLYAIQHDPKYFPEPEKFIPERFEVEEVKKRHPFVYLPFGDGPRVCIGFRFARLQTMVGLIYFLAKYTVERSNKTPENLKFSKSSLVLCSEDGINLKIKERKTSA